MQRSLADITAQPLKCGGHGASADGRPAPILLTSRRRKSDELASGPGASERAVNRALSFRLYILPCFAGDVTWRARRSRGPARRASFAALFIFHLGRMRQLRDIVLDERAFFSRLCGDCRCFGLCEWMRCEFLLGNFF